MGECTKGEIFPVLVAGERRNKCLASAGLLLIPCPSRENSAICSQFGPKLQDLISQALCKDFLIQTFKYDGAH